MFKDLLACPITIQDELGTSPQYKTRIAVKVKDLLFFRTVRKSDSPVTTEATKTMKAKARKATKK